MYRRYSRYFFAFRPPVSISSRFSSISYYTNKSRTIDWLKTDDSALMAEFKRASFIVFVDKQPLLRRSSTSPGYVVPLISHSELFRVADKHGLVIDNESAVFVDATPMQGSTNDLDEEFLPIFAVSVTTPATLSDTLSEKKLELAFGGEIVQLRRALFLICDPSSAHLLAKSQSLLRWSRSMKFCNKCASPLKMKFSKASAVCGKCDKFYYPSINPVAITLISNDKKDHLLLVRQPRHPPAFYSAVAGFSEVGETIEETVRREVAEEVGIDVDTIKYAEVSQPWPFPQMSLMLGFYSVAHGMPEPQVDKSELEDAQWFTRSQVTEAYQNSLKLHNDPGAFDQHSDKKFSLIPLAGALAHTLIKRWVLETA